MPKVKRVNKKKAEIQAEIENRQKIEKCIHARHLTLITISFSL